MDLIQTVQTLHYFGGLAQLARALALHARGHRFESDILHNYRSLINNKIMEILYIGLGILSSIFIFLLGYSVNGVFNGQKKVNELQEQIKTIDVNLGHIEEHIHIRINTDTNHLQTTIDRVERELVALLDSRLDKLEARIRKDIPITNDELLKEMNEIKDAFRQMRLTL